MPITLGISRRLQDSHIPHGQFLPTEPKSASGSSGTITSKIRPRTIRRETFSISSFYLVSQKELFPRSWPKALLYLPFLMALGIGLTITNTKAVIEALIGKQSSFARTPKYRVVSKQDKVGATKYRKRLGWVPWLELVIGAYFAMTVYYAVENENYITVPFLLLFVVGYWYTGLMSLLQGRFAGASSRTTSHTKPFPVGV